jgi:hypothetical protein
VNPNRPYRHGPAARRRTARATARGLRRGLPQRLGLHPRWSGVPHRLRRRDRQGHGRRGELPFAAGTAREWARAARQLPTGPSTAAERGRGRRRIGRIIARGSVASIPAGPVPIAREECALTDGFRIPELTLTAERRFSAACFPKARGGSGNRAFVDSLAPKNGLGALESTLARFGPTTPKSIDRRWLLSIRRMAQA